MQYVFTAHARKRMQERSITEDIVQDALKYPTKVAENDGMLLFKKLYRRRNSERLLLVVGEMWADDKIKIITVIDTSKVRKYL